MSGKDVVIAAVARTPFGRFGGALQPLSAVELGAVAIRAALERANLPGEEVDYVYMGMVLQAGAGQMPSRQATLKAGLPNSVVSDTINKVCISSVRAVSLAELMIRAGKAQVVVAGGMESMSNTPYGLPRARWGQRMGDSPVVDLMVYDGLTCAIHNIHMAAHGSTVAKEFGISRREQDEWALRSQQLAVAAMASGILAEEIVPVEAPGRKGNTMVTEDEGPRATTLAQLEALPPIFVKDGTVTAGNAPGVNDGASALVVMSRQRAGELGIKPLATIIDHATVAEEPRYIATVPGLATKKVLAQQGMTIDQIHRIEANEAFAAVALTSGKIAGWDPDRVNVNGGAIAFGHPIGASGGRILGTLVMELRRLGGGYGVAAICGGGAQGEAVLIRVD